jgi:hypothetical protein
MDTDLLRKADSLFIQLILSKEEASNSDWMKPQPDRTASRYSFSFLFPP